MRTMYKDGKECIANTDQSAVMEKAGWSFDKDEKVAEELTTDEATNDSDDTTEPEEPVKAKAPIKKKTAIKRQRKKINSGD